MAYPCEYCVQMAHINYDMQRQFQILNEVYLKEKVHHTQHRCDGPLVEARMKDLMRKEIDKRENTILSLRAMIRDQSAERKSLAELQREAKAHADSSKLLVAENAQLKASVSELQARENELLLLLKSERDAHRDELRAAEEKARQAIKAASTRCIPATSEIATMTEDDSPVEERVVEKEKELKVKKLDAALDQARVRLEEVKAAKQLLQIELDKCRADRTKLQQARDKLQTDYDKIKALSSHLLKTSQRPASPPKEKRTIEIQTDLSMEQYLPPPNSVASIDSADGDPKNIKISISKECFPSNGDCMLKHMIRKSIEVEKSQEDLHPVDLLSRLLRTTRIVPRERFGDDIETSAAFLSLRYFVFTLLHTHMRNANKIDNTVQQFKETIGLLRKKRGPCHTCEQALRMMHTETHRMRLHNFCSYLCILILVQLMRQHESYPDRLHSLFNSIESICQYVLVYLSSQMDKISEDLCAFPIRDGVACGTCLQKQCFDENHAEMTRREAEMVRELNALHSYFKVATSPSSDSQASTPPSVDQEVVSSSSYQIPPESFEVD